MIINRFSKLITADIHALLDSVEDPELTLRQAVRDMDQMIRDNEQTLARIDARTGERTALTTTLNRQVEGFDAQLDLCFANDDDDLARHVVGKKLAVTQKLDELDRQNEAELSERVRLVESLSEQRAVLGEIRLKAEARLDKPAAPVALRSTQMAEKDIDLALLQERHRRESQS